MAKNENSWGMWAGTSIQQGVQGYHDPYRDGYSVPTKVFDSINPNSTINTIYGPTTINHIVELIDKSSHIIKQLETRIAALELELKDSVWVEEEKTCEPSS